jgi:hypothetical protein
MAVAERCGWPCVGQGRAYADINDRSSLELVFPEAAFVADATRNGLPNPVRYGVRIDSAPDTDGRFELARTARHVGEPESPDFLAPVRRDDQPRRGYDQFLDDIVTAATRFGFREEESPGPGDARLHGLRQ